MIDRSARVVLAAALLALSACAVRPGMNPAVPQEALTPPYPIGRGTGPALVGATLQAPVAVEIVVQIDTLGLADLSTMRITGQGAEMNRQVIVDWLRTARFEPARLNGQRVRGWFQVAAEAKAAGVPE